ncbi:MAG: uncharacterized protein JWM12_2998 [Ilumatobacteraceae bacterium]|nr:uncharacterized protein [Ilumatobacteraceae bacterium]
MSAPTPTPTSTGEVVRRETNLRQLEIAITRRLDGMLQGDHQAVLRGAGSEAGEGRAYTPGDDARRIDWNLSARANEVSVRDTIADRELETWLVVDASASLDFGTAVWEKRDLAITAAAAFGLLGAKSGNRCAAVIFDGEGLQITPPRAGRDAVMQLLRRLEQRPRAAERSASLADAIRRTRALAKRRGRVVVISDLIDRGPWPGELRMAAARHEVVVAEVTDPREWELPAVGLLTMHDPETGRRLEVQTADPKLRTRFAAAATQRREENANAIRRAGAAHLQLSTDRDWMRDLVVFAQRHRGMVRR